ncbi:3'-5' exonuclease [Endothiovibrio diazotrophicus]
MGSKQYKAAYDPAADRVTVLTVHSSKGLEFPRVILLGVGQMEAREERREQDARLLYVGMTRARERLLVTTSAENEFSRKVLEVAGWGE